VLSLFEWNIWLCSWAFYTAFLLFLFRMVLVVTVSFESLLMLLSCSIYQDDQIVGWMNGTPMLHYLKKMWLFNIVVSFCPVRDVWTEVFYFWFCVLTILGNLVWMSDDHERWLILASFITIWRCFFGLRSTLSADWFWNCHESIWIFVVGSFSHVPGCLLPLLVWRVSPSLTVLGSFSWNLVESKFFSSS